jgi:quercetin dioxygenase-like cupin family protein
MTAIPYQTIDWEKIEVTEHPGEHGIAYWRTIRYDGLRIRMVEYSPGYVADHWCEKGHILFCLKGELVSELSDGSSQTLKENMSYHVSDNRSKHRSTSENGALLFIVDGKFLSEKV